LWLIERYKTTSAFLIEYLHYPAIPQFKDVPSPAAACWQSADNKKPPREVVFLLLKAGR